MKKKDFIALTATAAALMAWQGNNLKDGAQFPSTRAYYEMPSLHHKLKISPHGLRHSAPEKKLPAKAAAVRAPETTTPEVAFDAPTEATNLADLDSGEWCQFTPEELELINATYRARYGQDPVRER